MTVQFEVNVSEGFNDRERDGDVRGLRKWS